MEGFFSKVYEIVGQIPRGRVMTYGQIAAMLGRPRGAKVVGWAMRAAPDDRHLPCHRVVTKSGTMAPGYAFGGADIQRVLLEKEGVTFKENDCIDIEKHLWKPQV